MTEVLNLNIKKAEERKSYLLFAWILSMMIVFIVFLLIFLVSTAKDREFEKIGKNVDIYANQTEMIVINTSDKVIDIRYVHQTSGGEQTFFVETLQPDWRLRRLFGYDIDSTIFDSGHGVFYIYDCCRLIEFITTEREESKK